MSTCVGLRYGHLVDSLEDFPGSVKSETLWPNGLVPSLTVECPRGFAYGNRLTLSNHHVHQMASLSFCVTPSSNVTRRDRNVDLLSISYAFRPHLRTRLTLSGLTFLRKPPLHPTQCSPTKKHFQRNVHFAASVMCLSPVGLLVHIRLTSELLRFL